MWTGFHADLAASVPRGKHVVLADTSHATNQERAPEIAEAIKRIIEQVRLTTSSKTWLTRSYPSDGVQ